MRPKKVLGETAARVMEPNAFCCLTRRFEILCSACAFLGDGSVLLFDQCDTALWLTATPVSAAIKPASSVWEMCGLASSQSLTFMGLDISGTNIYASIVALIHFRSGTN